MFSPPRHKNAPTFRRNTAPIDLDQDLSVSNLRKLYSSLLEEMAPQHYEMATGSSTEVGKSISNIRWKNTGTITIVGDDDEGFDYNYTPDDSKKSWRLRSDADGGGMNGVTGGDWAKDGVRRYYTGGVISRGDNVNKNNCQGEILNIGSMDVDISTMNGVGLSPTASLSKGDDGLRDKNSNLFEDAHQLSLFNDVKDEEDAMEDVNISESLSADALTEDGHQTTNAFESSDNKPSMTTFESLFHISPTVAWRVRSAYAPTTPQEHDLSLLGSEALSHRQPEKAEGLELAKNAEARVCDGLWKVGQLICLSEKTRKKDAQDNIIDEGDDIEAAEAVFAYFCEKNILPMFIDAILCRPPPLSSCSTVDSSPCPFSGATWTAMVKSQILQVIAMLLFNTASPLSLTYLLSNNYMNELIMGILPLDQWTEEALEEILPPYVTLLRGLVMKLRENNGSSCVPLLICQRERRQKDGQIIEEAYFPLLFAAVQVLVSTAGSTLRDGDGCLVKTTAMNVILNLCRIVDMDVRNILVGGESHTDLPTTKSRAVPMNSILLSANVTIEQEVLFSYICKSLKTCYDRSVRLLMASLQLNNQDSVSNEEAKEEAAARHNDIAASLLSEMRYWIGHIDDLLSCAIREWNIRLCECIMRDVIVGVVLLNWNLSIAVLDGGDASLKVSEEIKAKAEIRTSVNFITQIIGMVEYVPLVRMVTAALLAEQYPAAWCLQHEYKSDSCDNLVLVTPVLQRIVTKNNREEADAGAGRSSVQKNGHKQSHQSSEMDQRALETVAAELNVNQLADRVENIELPNVSNRHRSSLLEMLAGKSGISEVVLASMLLAAILENDAIDDTVLETLEVLPSSEASPLENAISEFLITQIASQNNNLDAQYHKELVTAAKYSSSLGIMVLERIIFHTWTEDGTSLDEVPFDHYYSTSQFIDALQSSLHSIATYSIKLSNSESTKDIFADHLSAEIRKRYSRSDSDSVLVCNLSDYNPSNFIDHTSSACPAQSNNTIVASQFASDLLLHLRSLVMCIKEFHTRFKSIARSQSIADKRWCDEDQVLSFFRFDYADDAIISIGGFQPTHVVQVGTEIDLRGRTVFHGFEWKKKLSIVDASVMALILVIEPEFIYLGRKVRTIDKNRCVVDQTLPIRCVIASGTEGALLHVALCKSESDEPYTGILKGGKLTMDFKTSERSKVVKECLDKYCLAYQMKKRFEIEDFLDSCNSMISTDSKSQACSDF